MEQTLREFRETIDTFTPLLEGITEEESGARRSATSWSRKEVLGHLIDSAANNHQRFVRGQTAENLIFPGYDQDAWVAAQGYSEEPWSMLVRLWRDYNLHLLHIISRIPLDVWSRKHVEHNFDQIGFRAIGRDELASLGHLIEDYVAHLRHHLHAIVPTTIAPDAVEQ